MDNFLLNNFTIKELFDASKGALGKLFIKDEDFPTKKQERYRNFNIEEILIKQKYLKGEDLNFTDIVEINDNDRTKIKIKKVSIETLKNNNIGTDNFFQKLSFLLTKDIFLIDVLDSLSDVLRISYKIKDSKDSSVNAPIYILNVHKGVSLKLSEMIFDNSNNISSLLLPVSYISLDDNSKLDCYRYIETKNNKVILNSNVSLKKSSNYNLINLNFASSMIRQDIEINLEDEKSNSNVSSVNFSSDKGLVDNFININHSASYTNSSEDFKYVLNDFSKTYFTGEIFVNKGLEKIDASQNCKSILLSKEARAFARPWLKIFADDVKCSHGATFGELDKDALFYLETRGISEDLAKRILLNAFIEEVLQKIEDEKFLQICESKIS